jgi:hypothetical protein
VFVTYGAHVRSRRIPTRWGKNRRKSETQIWVSDN